MLASLFFSSASLALFFPSPSLEKKTTFLSMASSILLASAPCCCSCSSIGRSLSEALSATATPGTRAPLGGSSSRRQHHRQPRPTSSSVVATATSDPSSSSSSSSSSLRPSMQGIKRDASELFGDTPMVLWRKREKEKERDDILRETQVDSAVLLSFYPTLSTSTSPFFDLVFFQLFPIRSSSTASPRAAARALPASSRAWIRAPGK